MIWITRVGWFVLLGTFAGCGGNALSTSNPGDPPPHGGNLIVLPGGKGYVEVVRKETSSGNSPIAGEASFYVFKDMYTSYSPAPSVGTLTLGKKKITLKAEGEALVTPFGPPLFAKGDVDGTLSIELDGKATNIPLGVR
jgi:hypothetical protein